MLLWIWISIACEEEGNRIAEQSGTNRAANQFQPEEQIRQTLPFLSFPFLPFPSLPFPSLPFPSFALPLPFLKTKKKALKGCNYGGF